MGQRRRGPNTVRINDHRQTPWTMARRIAEAHGYSNLTEAQLSYILWNETGYPSFFDGDRMTVLAAQLQAFFSGAVGEEETQ